MCLRVRVRRVGLRNSWAASGQVCPSMKRGSDSVHWCAVARLLSYVFWSPCADFVRGC
jgi:hypothetical protein